ncbi:MAG: efflux RND transporter periplasmic adaptor subunit [Proteobacteria bacterium]|nr:efflux RND transporter periplasmic adaptor subunit [Pseudomonadota bacterium]
MTAGNFWPGLALAAFFLAACQPGAGDSDSDEDEAPAIPVETATPTRADIFAVYRGSAPIEAFADATVIAKVGGEVRAILVEEGDDVTVGEVLARLDGDRCNRPRPICASCKETISAMWI